MTKVAWKTVKGYGPYAYLQESVKGKGGKVTSKHIAYLGKAGFAKEGGALLPGKQYIIPEGEAYAGTPVRIPYVPDEVLTELRPKQKMLVTAMHNLASAGHPQADIFAMLHELDYDDPEAIAGLLEQSHTAAANVGGGAEVPSRLQGDELFSNERSFIELGYTPMVNGERLFTAEQIKTLEYAAGKGLVALDEAAEAMKPEIPKTFGHVVGYENAVKALVKQILAASSQLPPPQNSDDEITFADDDEPMPNAPANVESPRVAPAPTNYDAIGAQLKAVADDNPSQLFAEAWDIAKDLPKDGQDKVYEIAAALKDKLNGKVPAAPVAGKISLGYAPFGMNYEQVAALEEAAKEGYATLDKVAQAIEEELPDSPVHISGLRKAVNDLRKKISAAMHAGDPEPAPVAEQPLAAGIQSKGGLAILEELGLNYTVSLLKAAAAENEIELNAVVTGLAESALPGGEEQKAILAAGQELLAQIAPDQPAAPSPAPEPALTGYSAAEPDFTGYQAVLEQYAGDDPSVLAGVAAGLAEGHSEADQEKIYAMAEALAANAQDPADDEITFVDDDDASSVSSLATGSIAAVLSPDEIEKYSDVLHDAFEVGSEYYQNTAKVLAGGHPPEKQAAIANLAERIKSAEDAAAKAAAVELLLQDTGPVPPDIQTRLEEALAEEGVSGLHKQAAVLVEGWGEPTKSAILAAADKLAASARPHAPAAAEFKPVTNVLGVQYLSQDVVAAVVDAAKAAAATGNTVPFLQKTSELMGATDSVEEAGAIADLEASLYQQLGEYSKAQSAAPPSEPAPARTFVPKVKNIPLGPDGNKLHGTPTINYLEAAAAQGTAELTKAIHQVAADFDKLDPKLVPGVYAMGEELQQQLAAHTGARPVADTSASEEYKFAPTLRDAHGLSEYQVAQLTAAAAQGPGALADAAEIMSDEIGGGGDHRVADDADDAIVEASAELLKQWGAHLLEANEGVLVKHKIGDISELTGSTIAVLDHVANSGDVDTLEGVAFLLTSAAVASSNNAEAVAISKAEKDLVAKLKAAPAAADAPAPADAPKLGITYGLSPAKIETLEAAAAQGAATLELAQAIMIAQEPAPDTQEAIEDAVVELLEQIPRAGSEQASAPPQAPAPTSSGPKLTVIPENDFGTPVLTPEQVAALESAAAQGATALGLLEAEMTAQEPLAHKQAAIEQAVGNLYDQIGLSESAAATASPTPLNIMKEAMEAAAAYSDASLTATTTKFLKELPKDSPIAKELAEYEYELSTKGQSPRSGTPAPAPAPKVTSVPINANGDEVLADESVQALEAAAAKGAGALSQTAYELAQQKARYGEAIKKAIYDVYDNLYDQIVEPGQTAPPSPPPLPTPTMTSNKGYSMLSAHAVAQLTAAAEKGEAELAKAAHAAANDAPTPTISEAIYAVANSLKAEIDAAPKLEAPAHISTGKPKLPGLLLAALPLFQNQVDRLEAAAYEGADTLTSEASSLIDRAANPDNAQAIASAEEELHIQIAQIKAAYAAAPAPSYDAISPKGADGEPLLSATQLSNLEEAALKGAPHLKLVASTMATFSGSATVAQAVYDVEAALYAQMQGAGSATEQSTPSPPSEPDEYAVAPKLTGYDELGEAAIATLENAAKQGKVQLADAVAPLAASMASAGKQKLVIDAGIELLNMLHVADEAAGKPATPKHNNPLLSSNGLTVLSPSDILALELAAEKSADELHKVAGMIQSAKGKIPQYEHAVSVAVHDLLMQLEGTPATPASPPHAPKYVEAISPKYKATGQPILNSDQLKELEDAALKGPHALYLASGEMAGNASSPFVVAAVYNVVADLKAQIAKLGATPETMQTEQSAAPLIATMPIDGEGNPILPQGHLEKLKSAAESGGRVALKDIVLDLVMKTPAPGIANAVMTVQTELLGQLNKQQSPAPAAPLIATMPLDSEGVPLLMHDTVEKLKDAAEVGGEAALNELAGNMAMGMPSPAKANAVYAVQTELLEQLSKEQSPTLAAPVHTAALPSKPTIATEDIPLHPKSGKALISKLNIKKLEAAAGQGPTELNAVAEGIVGKLLHQPKKQAIWDVTQKLLDQVNAINAAAAAGNKPPPMPMTPKVKQEDIPTSKAKSDYGKPLVSKSNVAALEAAAAKGKPYLVEAHEAITSQLKSKLRQAALKHVVEALMKQIGDDPEPPAKQWTKIEGPKGSTPGGVYQDDAGAKYYVKIPQTLDHVRNELLAQDLYKLAGVAVLESEGTELDGKPAIASKWDDSITGSGTNPKDLPGTLEGFAADAWLANWDAPGVGSTKYDNILNKDGNAIRVDVGGALAYRGTGGPKGEAFGYEVTELDGLRNPQLNPVAATVYGGMSIEEIKASAAKVMGIPVVAIANAVKKHYGDTPEAFELTKKMHMRRKSIADWIAEAEAAVAKPYIPKPPKVYSAADKPEQPKVSNPKITHMPANNDGSPLVSKSNANKLVNAAAAGEEALTAQKDEIVGKLKSKLRIAAIMTVYNDLKGQLTGTTILEGDGGSGQTTAMNDVASGKIKLPPQSPPAYATQLEQEKQFKTGTKNYDADLTQVSGKKGSNEGGLFKDNKLNTLHYIKWPNGNLRAKVEALTGLLYEYAGVPVPTIRAITFNGKDAVMSDWLADAKPMTIQQMVGDKDIHSGFAVDAWLANWDVVGATGDNIVRGPGDKPYRIDLGGSMLFRAQGAPKAFGEEVGELKSMQDKSTAPQAAQVFGAMTRPQIRASAQRVINITDAQIDQAVDSVNLPLVSADYSPAQYGLAAENLPKMLKERLKARRDWLANELRTPKQKRAAALKDIGASTKLKNKSLDAILESEAAKFTSSSPGSPTKWALTEKIAREELGDKDGEEAAAAVKTHYHSWKGTTQGAKGAMLRWAAGAMYGNGRRELRRMDRFNRFMAANTQGAVTLAQADKHKKYLDENVNSPNAENIVDGLRVTGAENGVVIRLRNPGKNRVVIYRGWKPDQVQYLGLQNVKVGQVVELDDPPLYSWSFNPGTAKNFGGGVGSFVAKATVPIDNILLTDITNSSGSYGGENEVVFKGVPKLAMEVIKKP